MDLKLIKKMDALTGASTLNLSVSKKATASTTVEVGSTGNDDERFTDKQLTPGPASMPLSAKNSYNIVWSGAFVPEFRGEVDEELGLRFGLKWSLGDPTK